MRSKSVHRLLAAWLVWSLLIPPPALALRVQQETAAGELRQALHGQSTTGLEERPRWSAAQVNELAEAMASVLGGEQAPLPQAIIARDRQDQTHVYQDVIGIRIVPWITEVRRDPLSAEVRADAEHVLAQFLTLLEGYGAEIWSPGQVVTFSIYASRILSRPPVSTVPGVAALVEQEHRVQSQPTFAAYVELAELALQVIRDEGGRILSPEHVEALAEILRGGIAVAQTSAERDEVWKLRRTIMALTGVANVRLLRDAAGLEQLGVAEQHPRFPGGPWVRADEITAWLQRAVNAAKSSSLDLEARLTGSALYLKTDDGMIPLHRIGDLDVQVWVGGAAGVPSVPPQLIEALRTQAPPGISVEPALGEGWSAGYLLFRGPEPFGAHRWHFHLMQISPPADLETIRRAMDAGEPVRRMAADSEAEALAQIQFALWDLEGGVPSEEKAVKKFIEFLFRREGHSPRQVYWRDRFLTLDAGAPTYHREISALFQEIQRTAGAITGLEEAPKNFTWQDVVTIPATTMRLPEDNRRAALEPILHTVAATLATDAEPIRALLRILLDELIKDLDAHVPEPSRASAQVTVSLADGEDSRWRLRVAYQDQNPTGFGLPVQQALELGVSTKPAGHPGGFGLLMIRELVIGRSGSMAISTAEPAVLGETTRVRQRHTYTAAGERIERLDHGVGTSVSVELPITPPAGLTLANAIRQIRQRFASRPAGGLEEPQDEKIKILYVEDDPDVQRRFVPVIGAGDVALTVASTLAEAQRAIETQAFDSYIFDWFLGNGIGPDAGELLALLAQHPEKQRPILILSGDVPTARDAVTATPAWSMLEILYARKQDLDEAHATIAEFLEGLRTSAAGLEQAA